MIGMDKASAEQRIGKLRTEIERLNRAYFIENRSVASDAVMDALKHELKRRVLKRRVVPRLVRRRGDFVSKRDRLLILRDVLRFNDARRIACSRRGDGIVERLRERIDETHAGRRREPRISGVGNAGVLAAHG